MLVQFPGLIFLSEFLQVHELLSFGTYYVMIALVDPTYTYLPSEWKNISGGLGIFNASVATSKIRSGPLLSGLVINMLRDTTITKEVDPISEICGLNSTCVSYIVPGGPKSISPWPYNRTGDESLSAYITRGGPAYQLDFWTAPGGIDWTDACQVYGLSDSAFQLCMSSYGEKQIFAGLLFHTLA